MGRAVVVGQVARDLLLRVGRVPEPGGAVDAAARVERLGGKGANQAVALRQLGADVSLVGVVGDDRVGGELLHQARRDGIDVSAVVTRAGTPTGLVVSLLEPDGAWRYVQHLPPPVLLSPGDVAAAAPVIAAAGAVIVQLQQPAAAAVAAVRAARGLVVLDGLPPAGARRTLLAGADVLRCDATEARLLTGAGATDALAAAARDLLATGPDLVAFATDDADLFVWDGGHEVLPHADVPVVDTTGAGDAFTAALTTALLDGTGLPRAARAAVAAAADSVTHPGGRPHLTPR